MNGRQVRAIVALVALVVITAAACGGSQRASAAAGSCADRVGHARALCAGVPAGTTLRDLGPNATADRYIIDRDATVLDGVRIRADVDIAARNVVIRNSVVEGKIVGRSRTPSSFVVERSTVSSRSDCDISPGVAGTTYEANLVQIIGHDDGFRLGGTGITVADSKVTTCSRPGSHTDGVQDYPSAAEITIRDSIFDLRGSPESNAGVFLSNVSGASVERNLIIGGGAALRIREGATGTMRVHGNIVAAGSVRYRPSISDCGPRVDWKDNSTAQLGDDFSLIDEPTSISCTP